MAELEARAAATGVSRRPDVHGWVKADTAAKKDFFVDIRGDKDNLTYEGLYRLPTFVHESIEKCDLSVPVAVM